MVREGKVLWDGGGKGRGRTGEEGGRVSAGEEEARRTEGREGKETLREGEIHRDTKILPAPGKDMKERYNDVDGREERLGKVTHAQCFLKSKTNPLFTISRVAKISFSTQLLNGGSIRLKMLVKKCHKYH